MKRQKAKGPRPIHAAAARNEMSSKTHVVAAAVELVNEGGLDALTLAALAKRLGVKPPSLYKHVPALIDLRRQVATSATQALLAHLQAAVVGKSGREALEAVLVAFRSFARTRPGLYQATVETPVGTELEHVAARDAMIELIGVILRSCGGRRKDTLHVVRVLRAAVHGFVSLELSGGFGRPLDVDESFARLTQMLCDSAMSPGAE